MKNKVIKFAAKAPYGSVEFEKPLQDIIWECLLGSDNWEDFNFMLIMRINTSQYYDLQGYFWGVVLDDFDEFKNETIKLNDYVLQ